MEIKAIANKTNEFVSELLNVWESSVRATHDFLMEDDIRAIRPQVKEALLVIKDIVYITDENNKCISGFMAIEDEKIEMLFIHPTHRGNGFGKKLISYAVSVLNASLVDVNEQNTQGVGFYKHMGFKTVNRSPLDGNGNPFPILHMSK